MMFSFAVDYFIMVFVASLGVMQTAASIGGLRGLLVFKNPLVARPLGIAIAIAAIVWFFMVAERNINDYEGGLDSNQQGLLFFLAVAASGVLTCVFTSLLNWRIVDFRLRGNDGSVGEMARSVRQTLGLERCGTATGFRRWRTTIVTGSARQDAGGRR